MASGSRKHASVSPDDDPTSIGNLIVTEGLLTHEHLVELVAEYRASSRMLGEFLVEKGVLDSEQLRVILLKQNVLRQGGVTHRHVLTALQIARDVDERMARQMDKLLRVTSTAIAKAGSR